MNSPICPKIELEYRKSKLDQTVSTCDGLSNNQ